MSLSFRRMPESSNSLNSKILDSGSPLRYARNDELISASLYVLPLLKKPPIPSFPAENNKVKVFSRLRLW